jgi:hypothetical protein
VVVGKQILSTTEAHFLQRRDRGCRGGGVGAGDLFCVLDGGYVGVSVAFFEGVIGGCWYLFEVGVDWIMQELIPDMRRLF